MAQDEKPIQSGKDEKREVASLLPRYFRTTANRKFLSSTLDQMMQPGVIVQEHQLIQQLDKDL